MALEKVVSENDVKGEPLYQLIKKLQVVPTTKSLISASRIVSKYSELIPSKYNGDITKILSELASSSIPQVRKELSLCLGTLLVENGVYEGTANACLKRLLKDNLDTVRVAATEALGIRKHNKGYFANQIFPMVQSTLEYNSWKNRWVIAKRMGNLIASCDVKCYKVLIGYYFKLLLDTEIEVCCRALESLKDVAPGLEVDDFAKIALELQKLCSNENSEIRKSLASEISSIFQFMPKESEGQVTGKTIIYQLFKDESSEVRASLFANIEPFMRTQNVQNALNNTLPLIQDLLTDTNWQVRKTAIGLIESLMIDFPTEMNSQEKIFKAFGDCLSDKIACVRRICVLSIKKLSESLGAPWLVKTGLHLFAPYYSNTNYLYRLNYPMIMGEVGALLTSPTMDAELDKLSKLVKDPVANIRLHSVLALMKIFLATSNKLISDRVKKAFDDLTSDSDSDIRLLCTKGQVATNWKSIVVEMGTINTK